MARPWYPFYPSDYERDTIGLDPMSDLFYRRLLDLMWKTQQPVPASNCFLATNLRFSARKTRVLLENVRPFLIEKDGFLYQKKMMEIIERSNEINEKRAEAGRRGGLRSKANAKAIATANGQANGQADHINNLISTGVHNSTTSRGRTSDAHTPFPYDQWNEVPHSWVAIITNAGHAYQAEKVFLDCRDHYRMRHETASDWLSAWKKWVRGQRHTSDGKPGKSALTQSEGQSRNDHDLQSVGAKLGIHARPGESWDEYRIRVIEARERQARGG